MCTNFDGSVGRCNRCRTSAVRRLLRVASRVSRSLFSPLTSRGLLLRCSAAFLLQVQLRETIRDVKTLHNQNLVAVAQKKYVYIYDNQGAEARRRGPIKPSNTKSAPRSACRWFRARAGAAIHSCISSRCLKDHPRMLFSA